MASIENTYTIENGDLKIVYDASLGHHRIDPYPAAAEVESYYLDDCFYSYYSPADWFEKEQSEYQAGLWDAYYEYLLRIGLNKHKAPFAIDVGCGIGTFLDYWLQSLRNGFIIGIEPSLRAREAALSNDIYPDLAVWEYRDQIKANFISLILVLEHIANPLEFLKSLVDKHLAPGGRLLVVVPNDINPLQRRLGYTGFISSVHVNYFMPHTLRLLMKRAGLEIIHESATFPMEAFPLLGVNYFGNDALGRRCHRLRLRIERLLGWRVFEVYKKMYERWGIGRELIFVGEKQGK